MSASASAAPASVTFVDDPLSHPLYSTGLAATRGPYARAFGGLAALVNEEEDSSDEDAEVAHTTQQHPDEQLASPRRSNSAPHGSSNAVDLKPAPFTWTRPSAIRIAQARARAEAAAREKPTETNAQARAHHRAAPYGGGGNGRKATRGHTTKSLHTSPTGKRRSAPPHETTEADAEAAPTVASMEVDVAPSSSHASSSSSSYGPVRATHGSRRARASTSHRSVASRVRSRAADESTGEATMLLKMWNI